MRLKNVLRYLRIGATILRKQYPYKRSTLLVSYARFLLHSFSASKQERRPNQLPFREAVFDFKMYFNSYPEFINLFEEIFIFQAYRFEKNLQSPLIIDCGSNIGMSVLYFKMVQPHARVIAFEPEENNFSLLERNVLGNNLKDVSLHCVALSDKDGMRNLENFGSSSLNWRLTDSNVSPVWNKVVSRKLSEYISEEVALLKVDVEGAENLIWNDLIRSRKIDLIQSVIVEYHPVPHDISADNFIKSLELSGFVAKKEALSLNAGSSEIIITGQRTNN